MSARPVNVSKNNLLDALDDLTRPVTEHVPQKDDNGKWLRVHSVQLDPLLDRLEAAIRSSFGQGDSGRSTGADRDLINGAALYEFTMISNLIAEWCQLVNVTPTKNPTRDLRAWYVAYKVQPEQDRPDRFHIGKMRAWKATIESVLSPPRKIEIKAPCPMCGAHAWVDENDQAYLFPLILEYPSDTDSGTDLLHRARALCRACAYVWQGTTALRALRWEIDDQEAS